MRQNNLLWHRICCVAGLLICMAGSPLQAANEEDLQKIQKELEENRAQSSALKSKSSDLEQEAESLRAQLIALSQSVQQREANVTRLEVAIAELSKEEIAARRNLETRHGQSVDTLMAVQRLALNPPQAIIAQPQAPADMVRSAILLRAIVPQIQEKAQKLREDVQVYAQKRRLLEDQRQSLDVANVNLEGERKRLRKLINTKKSLSAQYLKDSRAAEKRAVALGKKAKDLQGLLDRLAAERKVQARLQQVAPPTKPSPGQTAKQVVRAPAKAGFVTGRPIAKSKGQLARPATGAIVMKFGEKEKLGGKHKGISIKTRHGAQVVATYDGQIAFAGPFRGYKQLLIIDHGDGYHTLLTGMDRIDVTVGQKLASGEPVATMATDSQTQTNLYFELRKNGAPINPLPWIGRRNAKAQG